MSSRSASSGPAGTAFAHWNNDAARVTVTAAATTPTTPTTPTTQPATTTTAKPTTTTTATTVDPDDAADDDHDGEAGHDERMDHHGGRERLAGGARGRCHDDGQRHIGLSGQRTRRSRDLQRVHEGVSASVGWSVVHAQRPRVSSRRRGPSRRTSPRQRTSSRSASSARAGSASLHWNNDAARLTVTAGRRRRRRRPTTPTTQPVTTTTAQPTTTTTIAADDDAGPDRATPGSLLDAATWRRPAVRRDVRLAGATDGRAPRDQQRAEPHQGSGGERPRAGDRKLRGHDRRDHPMDRVQVGHRRGCRAGPDREGILVASGCEG